MFNRIILVVVFVPLAVILIALAVVLAAATWFAFSGALANGHLRLDDPTYVFENEVVRFGLARKLLASA